jgi:hypothetical protein
VPEENADEPTPFWLSPRPFIESDLPPPDDETE